MARVKFEGFDDGEETSASEAVTSEEEGEEEEEREVRELVMRRNRKGKKSGGFQSMGRATSHQSTLALATPFNAPRVQD